MEFYKKVAKIQTMLKAPKAQFNKFGNYAYRNCEDILEAVKPLLAEHNLVLTVADKLHMNMGAGENYIEAIATITDGTNSISNSAFAREASEQKGMNSAQITGSTSSYARKYALNGLFLIDDTKDADATNTHGKDTPTSTTTQAANFTQKLKDLPKAPTTTGASLDEALSKTISTPAKDNVATPSFRRKPTVVTSGDDL